MKKLLILLIAASCGTAICAQKSSFTITYPIGFPMGNFQDYIDQVSFRGISLEFTRRQKPNLEVGLEASYSVFYAREDSKTYTEGTASVTGIQYRYTNAVPILAEAKYIRTGSTVSPYGGLGIGVLYVNRATDFGLYRITNEAWQFCLRPEVGVQFNINPGVAAMAGVKYYAGFNSSDMDGQSYLSVNVGMVFSK